MSVTIDITIDHTKVPATLTDFPVYVDLSDMPADFWSTVTSSGGDIRVYRSDGTTECAREVVSCDTATDTGELHFLANSISHTVDTVFKITVDGTSSDYAVTDTYGSNAVWGDYVAVYHLDEAVNNSTGGYIDASGKNPGTGNSMALTEVTGQIGDGQDFDGSADHILAPTSTSLNSPNTNNNISFSAWVKKNSTSGGAEYVASKENRYAIIHNYTANKFEFFSGTGPRFDIGTAVNTNWNHVVAVFDSVNDDGNGYLNGTLTNSTRTQNLPSGIGIGFVIGGTRTSTNVFVAPFDGKIDEVRIRADVRSANWITTEYNNQNDPATFYSATVAGGGGGVVSPQFIGFGGL